MYVLCQSSYISSTKCHVWLVAAVLGTEKNIFILQEVLLDSPRLNVLYQQLDYCTLQKRTIKLCS